ncbi:ATP-binding protein [Vibrio maerlii]|uniref:ATP-binding protein n=1 Tax=Vibrio maerlii TaxID=2231648 RepID=UPI000E3BC947|nr:ATP-binding protein [Vibrio maerlii]
MKQLRFESTYPSSLDASREAGEALTDFLNTHHIDDITVTQVELCIVEMVNNAYEHAYQEQEGKPVTVSCVLSPRVDGHSLEIEIVDSGESLTQQELETALSKDFIEADPEDETTWETSGRGFTIVKTIMDSVQVNTEGNLNRFLMKKALVTG